MAYRGENESEYLDDDEFFDPDDRGAGASNVLGGSGSWREQESLEDPPEDASISMPPQAAGAKPNKRPKRATAGGRKTARARNPAPSAASSEERRARLAGKKPGAIERDSQRRPRPGDKRGQNDEPRGDSRPGSLRARFSNVDEPAQTRSIRKATRLSALRGGIGGRIKSLGGRLGRFRGRGETSEEIREQEPGARSSSDGRSDLRTGASLPAGGPRESQTSRAPKLESAGWLDLDRKLDLIGVALVFGAIVFVLSALSAEQAAISGVNSLIGQALGWGAFAVPVGMFAIGLWLIIRHFGEDAPVVDPLRLSGVALAFLGILVFFQYIESFNYGDLIIRLESCRNPTSPACVEALVRQSYQAGRGGGLVGGWVYGALVNNLTELGGFVMMLMLLTVSAMLITRSSMAELAVVAIGLSRGLRTSLSHYAAKRRARRLEAQQEAALAGQTPQVRVSKPKAAQLTGASRDARALPEPSADTMAIPQRFRGLFGLRRRSTAAAAHESLPLAAEAERNPSLLRRMLSRHSAEADASPAPAPPEPTAGALERFLNLGDDLPFATEESPAWRRPSRPPSARPPRDSTQAGKIREIHQHPPPGPQRVKPEPPPITPPRAQAKRAESAPAESNANAGMPPEPPISTDSERLAAASASVSPDGFDDQAVAPAQASDAAPPEPDSSADSAPAIAGIAKGADGPPPVESAPYARGATVASSLSAPRARIDWQLPDYRELLNRGTDGELDRAPLLRQAQIIEDTLASFGAPGRVVEVNSGPVITQYGVEPAHLTAKTGKQNRVKVGAIAKLDKDLQLALGAKSIRVEAPVPGKGYVGIEVPNPDSARVSLRDVMESRSYRRIDSPLAIALGVSVDGTPVCGDLTQMPHLLIAGATGSGKSVCVNAIINSIIANNSPDAVKFIMVDPKRVELTGYNGLPHLVAPVVVELERTIGVLRWVTTEMDARYRKFSQAGARNIVDYNSILDPNLAPMPYIVVIIDELADLMMMAPDDTERAITRIAALARATGIHLVIATQRPSVDVVTGLIKANCPARIAFAVAGSVDSRVILDQPGAERLLGKGDMLYMSGNSPAPLRMQGVHVSNEEISRIIRYWKLQGAGMDGIEGVEPIPLPAPPPADRGAKDASNGGDRPQLDPRGAQAAFWDMTAARGKVADSADPEEDELYQTAVEMVRRLDKASISLLQRRLRIGYTRAARLVDMMEERGVVGPPKEGSSKPRDVLPE